MKVLKVAENQILLEDEAFKNIRDCDLNIVKSKTGLNNSEYDKDYEAMILAFRQPGMDASKQLFLGNAVSLYTIVASILENLVRQKIFSEELIQDMIRMIHLSLQEKGNK